MDQKITSQLLEEIHAIKKTLKDVATKDDLKPLVTKTYLDTKLTEELTKLREDVVEDICEINTALFNKTDEIKANQKDVDKLDKRVTKLEHN